MKVGGANTSMLCFDPSTLIATAIYRGAVCRVRLALQATARVFRRVAIAEASRYDYLEDAVVARDEASLSVMMAGNPPPWAMARALVGPGTSAAYVKAFCGGMKRRRRHKWFASYYCYLQDNGTAWIEELIAAGCLKRQPKLARAAQEATVCTETGPVAIGNYRPGISPPFTSQYQYGNLGSWPRFLSQETVRTLLSIPGASWFGPYSGSLLNMLDATTAAVFAPCAYPETKTRCVADPIVLRILLGHRHPVFGVGVTETHDASLSRDDPRLCSLRDLLKKFKYGRCVDTVRRMINNGLCVPMNRAATRVRGYAIPDRILPLLEAFAAADGCRLVWVSTGRYEIEAIDGVED